MSRSPSLLGIDVGTSSVKVVLIDLAGQVLAQARADYSVQRPHKGWAETDPELWWSAILDATTQVRAASNAPPAAIGLSGQMHGVVLCGADGTPIRPAMLWSDSRAEPQLARYRLLPAEVRARLGNPLSPGMAGPMLAWLAENEPENYRSATWALQPKDWVRARLTGRFHGEPSDASATLLYDLTAQGWDPEVIAALGLDAALLPPLLASSGQFAGELQPGPARELGLAVGIPVAAGAADTAAAALGSGLFEPGTVQLTIGTGAQLITPAAAPTRQGLALGAPVIHTYRAATATGWYEMAAVLNGGLALDWVRRTVRATWAELYAAAESPPGVDDPIFIPYLNGERTPHLDTGLTAAWIGLTGDHDRTTLLRTALEGVAGAIADALECLPGKAFHGRQVRLGGGGSTAVGWRQMLADTLDVQLQALDVPGASALGSAYTGALAADLIDEPTLLAALDPPTTLVAQPRPERADYYRTRRLRSREVFTALQSVARPAGRDLT